MPRFALAALGHDRPGIVAAITEALLDHGANVEDSRMGILRGHFSMVLLLAAPEGTDAAALAADLQAAGERAGLESLWVSPVDEAHTAPEPTHLVSVYGADHPGIVHAVAAAVAGCGATITDLQTRLAGGIYAMALEVAVPAGADLEAALAGPARNEGVELSVRELDSDAL